MFPGVLLYSGYVSSFDDIGGACIICAGICHICQGNVILPINRNDGSSPIVVEFHFSMKAFRDSIAFGKTPHADNGFKPLPYRASLGRSTIIAEEPKSLDLRVVYR